MTYTPADLARADQTLADLNAGLDKLIATCDRGMNVDDIDQLAIILDRTVDYNLLVVTLAVAIHRLAGKR